MRALGALVAKHLAIADEEGYELTGPLSWFGNFASAIAHDALKRFVVDAGDGNTHVYLSEVRVKGQRRPGDPLNETVAVLACAKTAPSVAMAAHATPSCAECALILAGAE